MRVRSGRGERLTESPLPHRDGCPRRSMPVVFSRSPWRSWSRMAGLVPWGAPTRSAGPELVT